MTKLLQRQRKKKRVALEMLQRARELAEFKRIRKREIELIDEMFKMEHEGLMMTKLTFP